MKKFILIFSALAISSSIFAQEAAPKEGGTYMQSLIMILLAVVAFYFILWRPEQKRRKAQQQQRDSLKAGDKVTAMGIVGTIDSVQDNTIVLKNIDGSKIEMLKAAVTEVKGELTEKTTPLKKKK